MAVSQIEQQERRERAVAGLVMGKYRIEWREWPHACIIVRKAYRHEITGDGTVRRFIDRRVDACGCEDKQYRKPEKCIHQLMADLKAAWDIEKVEAMVYGPLRSVGVDESGVASVPSASGADSGRDGGGHTVRRERSSLYHALYVYTFLGEAEILDRLPSRLAYQITIRQPNIKDPEALGFALEVVNRFPVMSTETAREIETLLGVA